MTNEQLLKMCRWDEINASTLVCKPSTAFWDAWRHDKQALKDLGVCCRRLGADFVATWTHNGSIKLHPVAEERAAMVRWSAEQEAIFAWFKEGKGNLLVRARAGTGKCLGPEVPVLMHDGSVKRNGDVRVGDMLMGPDGSPRRVLSVTSGVGPMYRIRPVRGDAWTCNDAHVLTLVGTNRVNGIIREVPLNVFLAETAELANVSRNWKLFRPSLLEFAPQAPPPVDPYFLGLWIGDGTKSLHRVAVSKPDPEVRRTCCDVADAWGLSIRESNSSTGACPAYYLTAGNGPGNPRVGKNQLLVAMRKLLGEFVRIPNCVRMGSVETRLSFLAGVLDSDGYLAGSNTIEIVQKRVDYAEDIAFIARSLGFFVAIREKLVRGQPYQRMYISGDCARIPMRLPRKKAAPRRQAKNPLRVGFEVEPLGEGEYFGFTLDGDGRFLLGDFTVTHNTATLKEAFKHAPEKIMLYAVFNKKNQVEASEKIRDVRVSVRTLHSLGYAYIKAHWPEVKFDNAVEFDRAREAAPNASDSAISCVRELVSLAKNRFVAPTIEQLAQLAEDEDCVPEDDRFGVADVAMAAFDALRLSTTPDERHRISFDDMVWLPVAAGWVRPWFDLVAIDEAQDMNTLQLGMAIASVKPGGRVVVVGDDRQCIYGFRGAVQDGLELMKRQLQAAELSLTETFRCPHLVVDMAREIVLDYRAHESNARGIVDFARAADLVSLVGPGNAILSRTNAPLAALCTTLLRNGKAAKIEGKDVGQMLVNIVRCLKARSVPHFVERLTAWSKRRIARLPDDDRKKARAAEIEDLVETLMAVADGAANVAAIVDRIENMFVDEAGKLRCVVLSTVHKAKGLEWPHVYTLEWTFKMKDPAEHTEEANIRYVAITRAKEHLTLVRDSGAVK